MKKTLENLAKAFAGESMARNRYNIYSKIAAKEGYQQIAEIFNQTAEQEREHAGRFFKMIQALKEKLGETVNEIDIPTTVVSELGDTAVNLQTAINGETHEFTNLYPEFANIAEEEGLIEIAIRIRAIVKAEQHHADRYSKLLKELKAGKILVKDEEVERVCSQCGYVHKGKTPPEACPSCGHDKGYFQIKCETY